MVNTANAKAKPKVGRSRSAQVKRSNLAAVSSIAQPSNFQHSSRPLHEMVRLTLQERIRSGFYSKDLALPSVPALAEEFGVSAITLKRALRDLKMAGLVRSVAGLGTFVREQERFVHDMSAALKLFGSKEDAFRSSRSLRIKLLSVSKSEIHEPALLPFKPPAQIHLRVEKMVFVDEIPLIFDRAFISQPVDEEFVEALGSRFIYEIVRERKMPIVSNRILIDAAPANADAQAALGIPDGYPTLRRCYHFAAGAKPMRVYGIATSPFDRVVCSLELSESIHT